MGAVAPPIQRRPVAAGTAPRGLAAVDAARGTFLSNPFSGVELSPAYIAFCVYIFSIVTYRVPLGTASMVAAMVTLPLEKQALKVPPLALMMFALIGWAFVGMTTTSYPEVVIQAVTEFAKIGAVVFVAVNVLSTRARFRAFVVGATIAYCCFPVRGTLLAYFVYHGTMAGRATWNYIYSNPNDLAGLTILALSVALGALAVERRKWVKTGLTAGVGLMVVVIVLTQSRGALIALVAFGIIGGRKYLTDIRRLLMIGMLGVVVMMVAPDAVWKRMSSISMATSQDESLFDPELYDLATRADQASSLQRLAIWEVARTIIAENAITGVGLGAYPEVHNVTQRRPGFSWTARGKRDTHSTYLNIAAEMGLVGFAIFVSMIVHVLLYSRRARMKMQSRFPALAVQQFNLEVGLYGYLIAAIWGSYSGFIATYIHLVVMYTGAKLLEKESVGVAQPVRRRGAAPVQAPNFTGRRRVGAIA